MTEDNSIRARLKKFGEKLPEQGRDEYYANTVARLDTIVGDSAGTWAMVSRANKDYSSIAHPEESFYVWLQEVYGIKLQFTPNGDLKLENEIIDEQKYLLFVLKYS